MSSAAGAADIPAYRASYLVVLNLQMLAVTFGGVSSVFISHLWQAGDITAMHRIIERNLRLGLLIILCGGAWLLSVGSNLFDAWLGPGKFIGFPTMIAFVVMFAFDVHSFILAVSSRATEDEAYAGWSMAAGVLKLIFSWVLVTRFQLFGLALATLLAQLLTTHWYMAYRGLRRLRIVPAVHVRRVLLPCAAICLCVLCADQIVLHLLNGFGAVPRVAASASLTGLVFGAGCWWLVLARTEREIILSRCGWATPRSAETHRMKRRVILAGTLVGLGGVQIHLRWLTRTLADAGYEVLALSFGASPAEPEARTRIEDAFPNARVIFVDRAGFGGSAIGGFRAVRSVLRSFRADVYFACGTGWNLFGAAALFGRFRGCVRIFYEVMSGEGGGWRDSRWLVRGFFDRVVAQAAPVARNFQRSFGWRGTIPVLPALPEPLEVTGSLPTVASQRVPVGTVRAALFSRLVPHKRAAWLVEQWPRLSKSLRELHIFGTGPEEIVIRTLIAERGWGDRVFVHGSYPGGQAYIDLLAGFHLSLLPTVGSEGAPLVLLESMACGVPFAATDAGGISDYENPDCLLAPRQKPEAFLEAVETLARRLDGGEIDQGRLQQFYLERFSFATLGARWRSFFESLDEAL